MSTQQSTKSLGWLTTTLLAVIVIPDWTQAVSLLDVFKPAKADEGVRLDPRDAVDFLRHPSGRSRPHAKWYQRNPDFQAWYKYYQKIGHHGGGLYEIDRIRLTYLQMRHLESVYGKDAPYYQYTIGMAPAPVKATAPCDPKRDGSCKPRPSVPMGPVAQPTPAPPNAPPELSCNLQDPACLLRYFYIFLKRFQDECDPKTDPKCSRRGMLPCDPKYDPACAPSASAPHPYTPTERRCNPVYDSDRNEGDHRDPHNPTYHEGQEDDGGSEADDHEADPYVPNYHGYYRDPNYYHRHTNPQGSSSNPNHYNSPNPNPNSHYSPNPYNSPYGSAYNSPYGYPYNSPYGSPYGPYYGGEDDDDGGEAEDADDY